MNLQSFIQSAHFYTVETCPEPLMAELGSFDSEDACRSAFEALY